MQEPSTDKLVLSPLTQPVAGASLGPISKKEAALLAYCRESGVSWAAFVDARGELPASASPLGFSPRNPVEIALLAKDLLTAAQKLAGRLGEREFHGLFQAGQRWHYSLSPVSDTVMLLSVFGNDTLPAAVRAASENHRQLLAGVL